MKKCVIALVPCLVLVASIVPAEAGRGRAARGGNFWGGFVAGAVTGVVTGALTGAIVRPPVVVAPPPRFGPRPRVARPVYAPRPGGVPGGYVVRYAPCGKPYRAWRRGYDRRLY